MFLMVFRVGAGNWLHEDDRCFKKCGVVNRDRLNKLCFDSSFLIQRLNEVGQTCPKSEISDPAASHIPAWVKRVFKANQVQPADDFPSTALNNSAGGSFGKFSNAIAQNDVLGNLRE